MRWHRTTNYDYGHKDDSMMRMLRDRGQTLKLHVSQGEFVNQKEDS